MQVYDGNNITGTVPASWTQLAALERIVMQPGNPDMCITLPQDATFSLCVAGDFMCLDKPGAIHASNCQAVAATAASAPASDSSSFPVAAVAVPVAVVGAAAIAAVGLFAWQRQRTRRAVTAGLVQQLSDENKAEWGSRQAWRHSGSHVHANGDYTMWSCHMTAAPQACFLALDLLLFPWLA